MTRWLVRRSLVVGIIGGFFSATLGTAEAFCCICSSPNDNDNSPQICSTAPGGALVGAPPQTRLYAASKWENVTNLNVHFLDGNDPWNQNVRTRVREIAAEWSKYANLTFTYDPNKDADISIRLEPNDELGYGVYQSYVGPKSRAQKPSMWLIFKNKTDERELKRVILHEFGHALGLTHEQKRPDAGIKWNEEAVYEYYKFTKWSRKMIYEQVMKPVEEDAVARTPFDPTSIMIYPIPKGLANIEVDWTRELSVMDKAFIGHIYPFKELPEQVLKVGADPITAVLKNKGDAARFSFRVPNRKRYTIEVTGTTPVLMVLYGSSTIDGPEGPKKVAASEGLNAKIQADLDPMNKSSEVLPLGTYFVDVKHQHPTTGTGEFQIAIKEDRDTAPGANATPIRTLGSRDYAVVIGIDKYLNPRNRLTGAAKNAAEFVSWLVEQGIPPENVSLMLGCDEQFQVPPGIVSQTPNEKTIVETIKDVVERRAVISGDRFFVYFAGHGMHSDLREVDAIMAADYKPGSAISIDSIRQYFGRTDFQQVFFIFDCCRENRTDRNLVGLEYPAIERKTTESEQFVFFATGRGMQAVDFNGTLTETFLQGLRGKGVSKRWDERQKCYVVRVNSLLAFLESEFKKRNDKLNQLPYLDGERHSDPVLAHVRHTDVAPVSLMVNVLPAEVVPTAEITVDGDGISDSRKNIACVPVHFSLLPRTYLLKASAQQCGPISLLFELYDDARNENILFSIKDEPPCASSSDNSNCFCSSPQSPEKGSLTVIAPDEMAPIELVDSGGRRVPHTAISNLETAIASRKIEFKELLPGFYSLRVQRPGSAPIEKPVHVHSGANGPIAIAPIRSWTSPLATSIMGLFGPERVKSRDSDFNAACAASSTGYPQFVRHPFATSRDLLVSVTQDNSLWEEPLPARLNAIGFEAVEPTSGLNVVLSFEASSRGESDPVPDTYVRFEPLGDNAECTSPSQSLQKSKLLGGVAQINWSRQPGSYKFSIGERGGAEIVQAVNILPDRVTQLIFGFGRSGRIETSVYMTKPQQWVSSRVLRRFELTQQFLQTGQLAPARELAAETLHREDPADASVSAFLLQGEKDVFEDLASYMIREYPSFCDSHVVMAILEEMNGNKDAAEQQYRIAMDCGLPTLGSWLDRLADAVKRYNIRHPRRELIQRVYQSRLATTPWTAWNPNLHFGADKAQ